MESKKGLVGRDDPGKPLYGGEGRRQGEGEGARDGCWMAE